MLHDNRKCKNIKEIFYYESKKKKKKRNNRI